MLGSNSGRGSSRFAFPIIAVLLVIISLLFLISSRSKVGGADSRSTWVADKAVIPLAILTMPIRGTEQMFAGFRERSTVQAENERLRARIAELSDAEMRANALAIKIKRFEDLLTADIGIDIPLKKIAARVVAENEGPFARSALLNVGAKHGVQLGYAVMTEDGLFGHVVAVGVRSSRVLLLQDINSRIAVMSPRSEARAIMVGTNRDKPKLAFVASDADWQDEDMIITSGDEGVLPRGLPVGALVRRGKALDVSLNINGKSVDWVWVLPYVPVAPPEDAPAAKVADDKGKRQENVVPADPEALQ